VRGRNSNTIAAPFCCGCSGFLARRARDLRILPEVAKSPAAALKARLSGAKNGNFQGFESFSRNFFSVDTADPNRKSTLNEILEYSMTDKNSNAQNDEKKVDNLSFVYD
jgi:hypothetical protein